MRASPQSSSRQEVLIPELLRNVLLGDEGDALREEAVDLHLELIVEELVDLLLPLLVRKPRIRLHLLGARDVLFGELDFDRRGQIELLVIEAAHTQEADPRHGHAHRLVGQADRALLDDAVDVETPRIVVDEDIDRKLELGAEALNEAARAARGLAAARRAWLDRCP